ncbi:MAG: ABC transporter permease [Firmicutes bacterium]|nr:ABC transporter permease [Bacillota bacterium]
MQCDKIVLISHFIRLLPYLLKTQFVFTVFQQTKWTQKTQTGLPPVRGNNTFHAAVYPPNFTDFRVRQLYYTGGIDLTLLLSVFEQGMIYAIMGLGVYITYKILDFPDLTVDGSFPLGAAIAASMISKDANPVLAVLVSCVAGMIVGIFTGIIHVKLKVRDLLSGIVMMTALYTVHLRIAGMANLPIYGKHTIFDNDLVNSIFKGSAAQFKTVIIIFIATMISKYLLDWYMSTKSGFMLRAVGDNETIVTSSGVDKGRMKIIGLAISNALVTMSGCIFAQQQGFYDASMGPGTVVIGLASVIIGTSLFKKVTLIRVTSSVVIGSILYKACVALAIKAGLPSTDLKLITAILFLAILIVAMDRKSKVQPTEKGSSGSEPVLSDNNNTDSDSREV